MPRISKDPNVRNPNYMLDKLREVLGVSNDAGLAALLDLPAAVISKIRHGRLRVSSNFLIQAHDASGLSIGELRELLYTPVDPGQVQPDARRRSKNGKLESVPARVL
jgi:hypothetical protein